MRYFAVLATYQLVEKCVAFSVIQLSGFERHSWPIRTNTTHRQSVELVQQSCTKTEQSQKESQYGCRYSALLRLSYFDPPCMLVIDPMHNFVFRQWKTRFENMA